MPSPRARVALNPTTCVPDSGLKHPSLSITRRQDGATAWWHSSTTTSASGPWSCSVAIIWSSREPVAKVCTDATMTSAVTSLSPALTLPTRSPGET
jgi:hypothetical protein